MKRFLSFILFTIGCAGQLFSQGILKEFIIELDKSSQRFYKKEGCTPKDGVIVFSTTIPNLQFGIRSAPGRLKNSPGYDKTNNCYVLCIQPNDTEIGGYTQYSIDITAEGYKRKALEVTGVRAGETQYFKINPKEDPEKIALAQKLKDEEYKRKKAEEELIIIKTRKKPFQEFINQIGVGIHGEWGLNYPSLKNQNGKISNSDKDASTVNTAQKIGITLVYPKENTTDDGIFFHTGANFGKSGIEFITSYNESKENLSVYTLSVPVLFDFQFVDYSFFLKIGVENNFNLNARYHNYLIDTHISDSRNNRMAKPYTLDGVIGFGFMKLGDEIPLALSFQYTRSLMNQLNTNYRHTINGIDFNPFEKAKLYNNMITVSLTWFIGGNNY
jgi:hypothetical protein